MRPRLVCALLVVFAATSAVAASPTAADSGQPVVSATIYSGSSGGVTTQSVTLGTLDGCPLYSGSSPMYLYPADQPYSPAASSSWALTTVITCGLSQPLGNVTAVQVDNPSHGFESPLSNEGISDPSQYHDPAAPNALPVVSVDGTENQNTYFRPWLGGSDDNASDEVVADGSPVEVVVYENGPPFTVDATQRTTSRTATAMTVQLGASVRNRQGELVPATDLTWSWNFGDGTTSTDSAPRHSFVPGVYPVTVQVADLSAGTGGTATIEVSFSPSSNPGSGSHSGAGRSRNSKAPSGPVNSHGDHPGGKRGAASGTSAASRTSQGSGGAAPSATSSTPQGSAVASPSPASRAVGGAGSPGTASATAKHASERSRSPGTSRAPGLTATQFPTANSAQPTGAAAAANAPIVDGRLISDVTPLPPGATPLLRETSATPSSAPAVRAASSTSILPVAAGALVFLVVFGAGAARELRGPVRWPPLRLGG